MGTFRNLVGLTFNSLTAIELIGYATNQRILYKCICKCGNVVFVRGHNLTTGQVKSCGCIKFKSRTHGQRGRYTTTAEYISWAAMKSRCCNPNHRSYRLYGGRGIIVCDRWINSFETFLQDVGKKPSSRHTLDRYPNKNGNYEPSNVRWATQKQQCNNFSRNVIIEHEYIKHTLSEWADIFNVKYKRLAYLITDKHLSLADALKELWLFIFHF